MKLSAAASVCATALAGYNDMPGIYCFYDDTEDYNYYYGSYEWSSEYDSVCPDMYDNYATYTCNSETGAVCFLGDGYDGYGYYDTYYGSYTADYDHFYE